MFEDTPSHWCKHLQTRINHEEIISLPYLDWPLLRVQPNIHLGGFSQDCTHPSLKVHPTDLFRRASFPAFPSSMSWSGLSRDGKGSWNVKSSATRYLAPIAGSLISVWWLKTDKPLWMDKILFCNSSSGARLKLSTVRARMSCDYLWLLFGCGETQWNLHFTIFHLLASYVIRQIRVTLQQVTIELRGQNQKNEKIKKMKKINIYVFFGPTNTTFGIPILFQYYFFHIFLEALKSNPLNSHRLPIQEYASRGASCWRRTGQNAQINVSSVRGILKPKKTPV